MPASDYMKRLLLDTIAANVNEMTLGFDGTPSTSSDGAAGRPAVTITPTITVIDDTSLLVEGTLGTQHVFSEPLKEVYLQFRDTNSFTPVSRHVIAPVVKNDSNEMKVQIVIEVR
tara:strand:+ start:177 stop:521 length:345 start_codon:yes stop_codon:yes gene_type:complete